MTKRERSIPFVFRANEFGNDILAVRLEMAVSASTVANHVKISASTVAKYERGAEDNMKMENFLDLCNLFDLDPRKYFELE